MVLILYYNGNYINKVGWLILVLMGAYNMYWTEQYNLKNEFWVQGVYVKFVSKEWNEIDRRVELFILF